MKKSIALFLSALIPLSLFANNQASSIEKNIEKLVHRKSLYEKLEERGLASIKETADGDRSGGGGRCGKKIEK